MQSGLTLRPHTILLLKCGLGVCYASFFLCNKVSTLMPRIENCEFGRMCNKCSAPASVSDPRSSGSTGFFY